MLLLTLICLIVFTALFWPGESSIRDAGTTIREGWGGLARREGWTGI